MVDKCKKITYNYNTLPSYYVIIIAEKYHC